MNQILKISVVVIVLGLLVSPTVSYADWGFGWGHRRYDNHVHYHSHPSFGFHVSVLPSSFYTVWAGRSRYYYSDGIYYDRLGPDYVVVAPPLGATVSYLPSDYQVVVVNGVTYYVSDGSYYIYTRSGYQVVPPPVNYVQTAPQVVQSQPVTPPATEVKENNDDSYTLNIPNDKGGYVSVTVKRSGKGFIGPQGEFYEEFPKVSQLKAMYVK